LYPDRLPCELVIIFLDLEIPLGMQTGRAFLEGFNPFMHITTFAAFPFDRDRFLENKALFNIIQKFSVS
jgi:hypothetical protein